MSTPRLYTTRALPQELLSYVFDYFKLTELLGMMLVSQQWMDTVMGHRTYWHTHILWSASEEAMSYFVLRLDRARSRPVSISIIQWSPSPKLVALILPAVSAHLRHTTSLIIQTHSDHCTALFEALRTPAPLLDFFMLEFDKDRSAPVLPQDIFMGTVPVLKTCVLKHVSLPYPTPTTFTTVLTLECGFQTLDHHLEQHKLAEAFPNVQSLMLRNSFSWDSDYPLWPDRWQRLDWVLFSLSRTTRDAALGIIPVADIKHLVAAMLPSDTMRQFLLHHVPGRLALCLMETPFYAPAFRMYFEDLDTDRVRGFIIRSLSDFMQDSQSIYYVLMDGAIASRITRLKMPAELWRALARFLPALHSLVELEIVVYHHRELADVGELNALVCPRLRNVSLRSKPGLLPYVAVRDLGFFAREALRGVSYPIALRLQNVLLEGNRDDLLPFFAEITCATSTASIYPYPYW